MSPYRRTSAATLALTGVLLGACSAPPRYAVRFAHAAPDVPRDVIVRSYDADDAVHLAEAVAHDHRFLLDLVPGTRPRPLEVWRLDEVEGVRLERLGADGLTAHRDANSVLGVLAPRWWGATRVLLLDRAEDRVVTHELAHALLDSIWEPLPSAFEEGLCDWLSFERFPRHRGPLGHLNCLLGRELLGALDVRLRHGRARGDGFGLRWTRGRERDHVSDLTLEDVLRLTDRTPWPELASHEVSFAYATGWLLADLAIERNGLDGLLAACERALAEGRERLEPQEVLDLADVPAEGFDPIMLRARQVEAFRRSALSEPELLQSLAELYRRHARANEPAVDFVERLSGRLRIEGQEDAISWEALPGYESLAGRLGEVLARL